MKVTLYPRNIDRGNIQVNPYIKDFIQALEEEGIVVNNPPHKNPLFSLVFKKTTSDVYIFHWLENVPDYKYGILQALLAFWFLIKIRLRGKKIVWFLHNKQSHTSKHQWIKKALTRFIIRQSSLIVTHATEGIEVIHQRCEAATSKTIFMHHPTKNRLPAESAPTESVDTDLLLWGNISRYKGVLAFVRFAKEHLSELRIKIIGKCSSDDLLEELSQAKNEHISIENRSIPYDELKQEIQKARYVLIPYAAESILSSGILMDSLSFGAKVIGPNVGSFRDYAHEPLLCVHTFNSFDDLRTIMNQDQKAYSLENYQHFLNEHSWKEFSQAFHHQLQTLLKQ